MAGLKYDKVIKYIISAKCEGPLHIGSSVGGKEEVLIHPVDSLPFIQASSIAGVFRSYAQKFMNINVEELFGISALDKEKSTTEQQSRVRFTDGKFDIDSLKVELRPHVKIDRKTGSVSNSKSSGQKFDIEYIGSGSQFVTSLYVYIDSSDEQSIESSIKEILGAMKAGILQFGAKKSCGAGIIVPVSVKSKTFVMSDENDRKAWLDEETLDEKLYKEVIELLPEIKNKKDKYKVIIKGKTEGSILIKGLSVSSFGEGAPDCENIRNVSGEYIVPGSSFRGAIRSQMEKISRYLGKESLIDYSFGKVGLNNDDSFAGNLVFNEAVIGDKINNDKAELRHRIHIDKFTGGVFNQELFAERNAFGDIELEINIVDKNEPDVSLGLLLMAVRDLASKVMSLGSGFATGKGFIDVSEIIVDCGDDTARIVYNDNVKIEDSHDIIKNAITALREVS